jgi:hypothetical protein
MSYENENEYVKSFILMKTPEMFHAYWSRGGEPDVEKRPSITIPLELTRCAQLQAAPPHKRFAKTQIGKVSGRRRSFFAMNILKYAYPQLPEEGSRKVDYASRVKVARMMRAKIAVDGGAENTVGRLALAYPKKGSSVSRPPTDQEVEEAIRRCGLDLSKLPPSVLRPFPIITEEGIMGIKVNKNATSGFPVIAKITEDGVLELVLRLAYTMRLDLDRAYKADKVYGVWNQVREWEETQPWLVACMGKCKADCYSQEKIEKFMMRFYNAFPRQVVLLMQQTTQVMEEQARNMLQMAGGTSAQGMTLVRGGASDLVDMLDIMLMKEGYAYTHVGDDTWCAVKVPGRVILFSLDCSNFDITQHADATIKIHEKLRDQLSLVDPVAAQLWYAFMRERLVVTKANLAYQWKHGGPSGSPMQSKVNDVYMDVFCQRVMEDPLIATDKEALEKRLQLLGEQLHLKVRLEDYEVVEKVTTIREALHEVSFLYIGYRFYAENNKVYVFADIGRSLAQFPYPGLKWTQKRTEFEVNEGMRMGSILVNMGRPPQELKKFFDTMKANVVALLEKVIAEYGDVKDEKLAWAIAANPWGAESQPGLVGLREAITNMDVLWSETQNEEPLPSSSQLLTDWSDMMDEQDKNAAEEGGYRYVARPGASLKLANLKQLRVRAKTLATHPATLANLGRPAPTSSWGPDKPKRDLSEPVLSKRSGGKSLRKDNTFYDDMASDYGSDYERSEEDYGYY